MDEKLRSRLLAFQRDEITSALLYARLAKVVKEGDNARVLADMSAAERRHYAFWKNLTGRDVAPRRVFLVFAYVCARMLGLTFTLKLLERGEAAASAGYAEVERLVPGAADLGKEEDEHEDSLMAMIEEERLEYMGSIVLGLNDALVELTGTLAGLTFALRNAPLVAASGVITGIAAAFSMAASDYLASRADGDAKAGKSAVYTGVAYLLTVVVLVLPYLVLPHEGSWIFVSLALTLFAAVAIIAGFNFYISVAKSYRFRERFLEMAGISLGVAGFSFLVGFVVRSVFGIEI
ncbi:MAG: VIT1/CCC1 transporter family protein [Spirochaetales bacterium]|nr:VIT1/CCC1 transporter family protein [Spirochaetales bacterium]